MAKKQGKIIKLAEFREPHEADGDVTTSGAESGTESRSETLIRKPRKGGQRPHRHWTFQGWTAASPPLAEMMRSPTTAPPVMRGTAMLESGAVAYRRLKNGKLLILLIDLDAQASLTFSFISAEEWGRKYEADRTIKAWFDSFETGEKLRLSKLISKPERVNRKLDGRGSLDVIYSHLGLINVDLELAVQIGGATLAQARRNFLSVHKRLLVGLSSPDLREQYDVCLIDCPPNFNIVTKTAIVASNYILVPTRPDQLSTLGIDYLLRSIRQLIDDYNEFADLQQGQKEAKIRPKIAGVVFTMIQEYGGVPISAQRTYMHKIAQDSGLRVFNSYITRNDTMFAGAPEYGVPVVLTGAPNYSHQKVVDGIEQVATEFLAALGMHDE